MRNASTARCVGKEWLDGRLHETASFVLLKNRAVALPDRACAAAWVGRF
jgi:hypothetical protein